MARKAKTGKGLERRVADAYRETGAWKVEHDVELAGNQMDVYVELEMPGHLLHRIAVEAKDWKGPVGIDVVNGFAQIVKLLHAERLIDEGVIVSATGFSRPGRNAAQTHGIRLLEPADLDAMVAEAKEAGRTRPTAPPVPPPPTPYIAHPYPAQEHFTGRDAEREALTAWLSGDAHPLLAVIAIGGMGKSALAWHWLHHDLLPLDIGHWSLRGALWWCFYDRESGFERFLERGIAYASGGEMDASRWPVRDRMECLCRLLAERRFLLVLDGVERLLRAYARMDAPYLGDDEAGDDRCAEPNVATFLQWLAGLEATQTLLTSRLLPRELDGLAGVARRDLMQMDAEDAVYFFHAAGVQGTRAEIQAACAPYGYLPLALRLLVGLVAEDPARPGDIAVASEYEITEDLRGKEHHHILERAYNALDLAARDLLSRIAAFRSPVAYDALRALFTSAGGGGVRSSPPNAPSKTRCAGWCGAACSRARETLPATTCIPWCAAMPTTGWPIKKAPTPACAITLRQCRSRSGWRAWTTWPRPSNSTTTPSAPGGTTRPFGSSVIGLLRRSTTASARMGSSSSCCARSSPAASRSLPLARPPCLC